MNWPMCFGIAVAVAAFDPSPATAYPSFSPDAMVAKNLVRIDSSRKINMNCLGSGAPAVVFEQGFRASILTWEKVAPAISAITTVCVYDRAGEGFSPPSNRPTNATNVVDDLHSTLLANGIRGPIVLVGHSVGGLYATLFKDKYPDQVAGLVLVDSSFAGQDLWIESVAAKRDYADWYANDLEFSKKCIAAARAAPIPERNPACFYAVPADRTEAARRYLRYSQAHSFKWKAELSEAASFHADLPNRSVDEAEEDAARRSWAQTPVVVLTAAAPTLSSGAKVSDDQRKDQALWMRGHDDLAKRSSRGKSIVVPASTHFIQTSKPEAVIGAIKHVIRVVRTGLPHP